MAVRTVRKGVAPRIIVLFKFACPVLCVSNVLPGEKAAQAFLFTLALCVPKPPRVYIITRLSRKP